MKRVRRQLSPSVRPEPPERTMTSALVADAARRLQERAMLLQRCRKSPTVRNVHRLRVESRRLLARLELLADVLPAWVGRSGCRAVRKQLRTLGELRDLQVHLGLVDELLPRHPELQPFRRHLRQAALVAIPEARRRLGRRKPARRLRDLAVELAGVPEAGDVGVGAMQRPLRHAWGDVVRRAAAAQEGAGLHRLRLALKHCRYLTEALQAVLPASTPAQLARLRAWQTCLGDIHDLEVLEARLRTFAEQHAVAGGYAGVRRLLARRRRRLGSEHAAYARAVRLVDGESKAVRFVHLAGNVAGKGCG